MKLVITRSKNSVCYYVGESFRKEDGTSSTRIIEKLGTHAKLLKKLGNSVDIKQWCQDYVKELTAKIKANLPHTVQLKSTVDVPYEIGEKRSFSAGQLVLQRELYGLGLFEISKAVMAKHNAQFELEQIVSDLICSRILTPSSKRHSRAKALDSFLEKPKYELHDVYRALSLLAQESDFIQAELYKSSARVDLRDTSVLFYDCTNFYFEIEQGDELRKYGRSKENRPNPIVQMGLFTDRSGLPLGMSIFEGNCNEQRSLKPLETQIIKDFELAGSKMIVCTDAGLASSANRTLNTVSNRSFIVVQPIKIMSESEQEWCLSKGRSRLKEPRRTDENPALFIKEITNNCWRQENSNEYISLEDLNEDDPKLYDKIFYKEKTIIDKKGLSQRLIVSYSIKYKRFMEAKRARDVMRAEKLVALKNFKKADLKTSDDIRRYIKLEHLSKDKDQAMQTKYSIDEEEILRQARYDGFYAVCTSIPKDEMKIEEIININRGRWEIEEAFRIMKTELKSRPVFLQREDRIKAHFLTCFIALLVFRILEKKVATVCKCQVTAPDLVETLRLMNISKFQKYFTGSFTRTELTDAIHEVSNMRFDCELISPSKIKAYIKSSKKIFKPKNSK